MALAQKDLRFLKAPGDLRVHGERKRAIRSTKAPKDVTRELLNHMPQSQRSFLGLECIAWVAVNIRACCVEQGLHSPDIGMYRGEVGQGMAVFSGARLRKRQQTCGAASPAGCRSAGSMPKAGAGSIESTCSNTCIH